MAAEYPTNIPALGASNDFPADTVNETAPGANDGTILRAEWWNKVVEELRAVMVELGPNPSGSYTDVVTRLNRSLVSSTTNPTASNNAAQGYAIGSLWLNHATKTLYALTAFNPTTGAATWTTQFSPAMIGTSFLEFVEINASLMQPSLSAGAVLTGSPEESETNALVRDFLLFEKASLRTAQFNFRLPDDFDDTEPVKAKFVRAPTTATGGVAFGIATSSVGNDEAFDSAFSGSSTVVDDATSLGREYESPATNNIVSQGWAKSQTAYCRVSRHVGNAGDTNAGSAKLLKVILQYTRTRSLASQW